MAEEVSTGGMMKFRYGKGSQGKLNEEDRKAIQLGYEQARERRQREKRNKIVLWIIIVLIILAGLGYWFLR